MTPNHMDERWLSVPCAPKYEVSSHGRIRRGERMLAGYRLRNGYVGCSVSQDGRRRSTTIHALVAEAFIPNPGGKPEVNHKNGVKDDNRAENLEWVTRSENQRHSRDVLGNKGRPKKPKPASTIPDLRRRLIVEDYDTGTPTRTVFDLYRTPRIDTYRVAINGAMRKETMGWSAVLVAVRKAKPRKCSLRWMGG